jgi:hypothetical protein
LPVARRTGQVGWQNGCESGVLPKKGSSCILEGGRDGTQAATQHTGGHT